MTGFNFPSLLANFLLIREALDHSIQVALLGEWGHVNTFQRTSLENHLRKTPSSPWLLGHLGNSLKKLMLYFYLLTQRIFWFHRVGLFPWAWFCCCTMVGSSASYQEDQNFPTSTGQSARGARSKYQHNQWYILSHFQPMHQLKSLWLLLRLMPIT